ncbi:MAG TPA: hypothetical protein VG122_11700 [Gemmata sp.]|jgi:hypothetical protein|nr:hypothetical protein [Gemmata sp.]
MSRPACIALAAAISLSATGAATAASPRDEVLRVAPADAAIFILVQNARGHYHNLSESPFVEWFPTTTIGKQLLESIDLKQLRASGAMIFSELGTTPTALLEDVLGEATAFAYSPASPDRPNDERALILIRPRKPDALAKILDKMNDLQTRSGEVKAIVRKEHAGATYHERQKPGSGSEFYCFRGDVFAFSSIESEIKAFIDRDKAAALVTEKPPELLDRMTKLGIADAAGVILINPRALDAEVKAKVAGAKPDEKRFLSRFAEIWSSLDSAAIYLTLDKNLELGVSVRFQPGKLPADAKKWLTGTRNVTTAECLIPNGALFGFAAQVRATELIELIASLAPLEPGKPDVKAWITLALGPIVGRDKLPLVLDALGPNWAVWAEPPTKDGVLPTFVAAVEINGEGETRAKAEKALLQAVEFGFQTARVAYNTKHTDQQIEVKKEKDPRSGAAITTLVNDKFPPGFSPSFALVGGYLVIATSPDAIKRFEVPGLKNSPPTGFSTVAKFSGTQSRAYLLAHGPELAKFLADLGVGPEKTLREQLDGLTSVLELIDSADIITRGDENGMRLAVRINLAKPLKK